MTYNKPEVVKLDSALKAIQGFGKPFGLPIDSVRPDTNAQTPGAYEADE